MTHSDWRFDIDKIDDDGFIVQASIEGPGGQVAEVVCENILYADDKEKWNEVAESTGRLIAAAPELLAACERVLRAIEWSETSDRMSEEEMADTLRDAIAKAEGTSI